MVPKVNICLFLKRKECAFVDIAVATLILSHATASPLLGLTSAYHQFFINNFQRNKLDASKLTMDVALLG
jgi:hypothetical protein